MKTIIVIIAILSFALTSLIFVRYYLIHKWYYRGYNETLLAHLNGTLGKVDKPSGVYLNNENRWWHRGAYDAYCEIKQKENKNMKKSLQDILNDRAKGIETIDKFGEGVNEIEGKIS